MRLVSRLVLMFAVLWVGPLSVLAQESARLPGFYITTTDLPSAVTGQKYSQQLTAIGGTAPYKWRIVEGVLPKGIKLSSSGELSGTPKSSGSFTFTVRVRDSATSSATIQIGGKINETS